MKNYYVFTTGLCALLAAGCAGPQFRAVRGLPQQTVAVKSVSFEREIGNKDWKSIVDVAAGRGGVVNILDASTHQVISCDSTGRTLLLIGDTGFWSKTFPRPAGIGVDGNGRVFVSDTKKDSVRAFDRSGAFSLDFGKKGSRAGQFRNPRGVTVDGSGNIYVVDQDNYRVQKFDPSGQFRMEIASGPKEVKDINISRSRGPVKFVARPAFNLLADVAVGPQGTVYILDEGNCVVHAYGSDGSYLLSFGGRSRRMGSFLKPRGIAVGAAGVVCVSDEEKADVQIFGPAGRFITRVGGEGDAQGQFDDPQGIDATRDGRLYVADGGNRRVQIFSYSVPAEESVSLLEEPVRIAIFDFKNSNPATQSRGYGDAVSEMFITAFARSPNFEVVERKQLRKVLDEIYFDQTGVVEEETAKKIGKILGIDIALVGSVAAFTNSIEIDLRLLDVETGKVVIADSLKASHESRLRTAVNREARKLEKDYSIRFSPPRPPGSLKVNGGVKSFALIWDESREPDFKEYRIYRAEKKDGPFERVHSTSKTGWVDSGFSDGSVRFYRVTAVDTTGRESRKGSPLEGRTSPRPSVGRLRVKKQTKVKKVSFSWKEDEENVAGYVIYRSSSPDGPFEQAGESSTTGFSEGGFSDGETYYYQVVKRYRNGLESEPSAAFSVSTEAKPAAPAGLKAKSDLARRVELGWSAPGEKDIRRYSIYRSGPGDDGYEQISTVERTLWAGTSYTDSGLDDHETYSYKIQAVDKYDLSGPMSAPVTATTKKAPSQPRGIEASDNEARRVTLAWNKNPEGDISAYELFVAESEEGPFRRLARAKNNILLHRDCDDQTRYYYKVKAIDRDGLESIFSGVASAVTKPRPSLPQGLDAESGLIKSVRLRWEKNPETDIADYALMRRTGGTGSFDEVGRARENSYFDTGLLDGTLYQYIVKAVDADGLVSDASRVAEAGTKPRPAAPAGLKAESRPDRVILTWEPNPEGDIVGYEVFRSRAWDILGGEKKKGQEKGLRFEDCDIKPGKTYYYRITAFDEEGLHSDKSEKATATLPSAAR